jgi:hypothetical protein
MGKILAQRFAPFDFYVVSGFPNVVPTMDEWGDYLSIFREHKEENLVQHLHEFHELMHQWEIHHEDVLLKKCMFSVVLGPYHVPFCSYFFLSLHPFPAHI